MPIAKKTDAAPAATEAPAAPLATPPAAVADVAKPQEAAGQLTAGEIAEKNAQPDVRGRVAHGAYMAAAQASGPLSFSTNMEEHQRKIDDYAKFLIKRVWERQAGAY